MKNTIKVWLEKRIWSRLSNDFRAEVACKAEVGVTDILEDLFKDGVFDDMECGLQFVAKYNEKIAEYAMSGYKVDTGLVTLKAEIKTPIINRKWNDKINSIEVSFEAGKQLLAEIENTKVEILNDKVESDVDYQYYSQDCSQLNRVVLNSNGDVPACGIAFRTWLCKT